MFLHISKLWGANPKKIVSTWFCTRKKPPVEIKQFWAILGNFKITKQWSGISFFLGSFHWYLPHIKLMITIIMDNCVKMLQVQLQTVTNLKPGQKLHFLIIYLGGLETKPLYLVNMKNLVLDWDNNFYLMSLTTLVYCLQDNVWMLREELTCELLMGVKGLLHSSSICDSCNFTFIRHTWS